MSEPFIAEVRIFAGNFPPRGWADCNGQLLPISQNTALFSLIGTTYGGDGRTTTALPDLRDRAAMHPGRGPGLSDYRLGQTGGSDSETLNEAQMPAHSHALKASDAAADSGSPGAKSLAHSGTTAHYNPALDTAPMAASSIAAVGGSQAHNNMQPYLSIRFIIALVGLYPSRS